MLNSKQRAQLRAMANRIDPIFQIGKQGISEEIAEQISLALEARELIKVSVLETAVQSPAEIADQIAEMTDSDVVQKIGRRFILYRESRKHKRIEL